MEKNNYNNKLNLVKYLYINNCPLDKDLFIYSINYYSNKKEGLFVPLFFVEICQILD